MNPFTNYEDRMICGLFSIAGLALLGLIALVVKAERDEDEARHACYDNGGAWVVVGHHYVPPTYVSTGGQHPVMVPIGGYMARDYGCVGRGKP